MTQNDNDIYKNFDSIIQTIFANVLVERQRCGKIILYNFNPIHIEDKLYFNVAALAADVQGEYIYVDMSLLDYFKFKRERGRKQKNVRWLRPWRRKEVAEEDRVSVYKIMNFVKKELGLTKDILEEINNEYYGWGEN